MQIIKSIILFGTIFVASCNSQRISKSDKKEISNAYMLSVLNVDSVLIDSFKIKVFHNHLKNIYGTDIKTEYIETRCIARDSTYKNIGMYSYRRNSAHHPYKFYFLNFADSLSFIEPKDTLIWNERIEKFISTYNDRLTQSKKNALKQELLK